jgi:hypothetical protein
MELKHVFVPPPPPARKAKSTPAHPPSPGEKLDRMIDKYRFWR